jgi:hypothetical protein
MLPVRVMRSSTPAAIPSASAALLAVILGACGGGVGAGGLPFDASAPNGDGGAPDEGGGSEAGGDAGVGGEGGPGTCTGAAVAFTMHASTAGYCLGPGNCTVSWLTILLPDGTPVHLDNQCATDCTTCEARACPPGPCQISSPVPADGQSTTWDGTYYLPGSCGNARSCLAAHCAAAGRYTARFCAYKSDNDGGLPCLSSTPPPPICTDVPFDWPTAAGVSGSVP